MADSSEDPRDVARMRDVDRVVNEAKDLLTQQVRQAEREEAARKREGADSKRDRAEAKRVALEAQRRVALGSTPGVAATPEAAGRMAGAVDRETAARERHNRQLRAEAVARREALKEQLRQQAAQRQASRARLLPVLYEAPTQLPGGGVLAGRASPAQAIEASAARIRHAVQLESEALRLRGLSAARHAADFERLTQRLLPAGPAQRALPAGPLVDLESHARLLADAQRAAEFTTRQTQRLLNAGPQVSPLAQHQQYAGFGGGPPKPPPPAPPTGPPPPPPDDPRNVGRSLGADKTARLAAEEDRLLKASLAAARGQGNLAGSLEQSSLALGSADNAYRRHGALTTEFINAAARGQTTFRELGYQVGTTIGKFAGWTAAAASVYGVLGAVQALGRGALDSASGVGLLERVVTTDLAGATVQPGGDSTAAGRGALQRRFRDLSDQFNLPIADVTQAAYGSAKAFSGDLPQALKATEQALFAVKVGELSAVDSTQSLNSIVKGFQLTAEELPLVFDTINQAQNRFGGNVGNLVKGVGKAGGAFKNAGGTYRELIAILAQGARLTGVPETEVATAVQRAASTVQTPQGQARLAKVGLGGKEQTFPELLAEAAQKAQTATPEQVNAIARSLIPAGGQFARIFTPLLRNRDLYNEIFAELAPEKAAGSGARELEKALAQPNEQIKALATNIEQLGSALAQAGALNLFVGIVQGANAALDVTTALLDVFDEVGDSIRGIPVIGGAFDFALPLAQLGLMVKLLRRFDAGGSLPAGRLADSLRRPEGAAFGARLSQGIGDQRKFLEEERRRAAQQAASATFRTQRAFAESAAAGARVVAPAGTPERLAQEEEAAAAHKRYEQEQGRAARLERDQVYASEEINDLKRRELEYQRLRKQGLSERVAAERAGFQYVNPSLDRPVADQPGRIGGIAVPRTKPSPAETGFAPGGSTERPYRQPPPTPPRAHTYGRVPGLDTPLVGVQSLEQEQARARQAADRARAEAQRLAREAPRTGRILSALGVASGATGVAGRGLGASARAARGALRAAGAGITAAAGGLRSVASQLGTIDKLLIGAFVAYEVYQSGQQAERAARQALARIRQPGQTPDALRAQAEVARRQRERLEGRGESPFNPLNALKNVGSKFHDLPNDLTFGLIGESNKDIRRKTEELGRREASRLQVAQAQGRELRLPQISANFRRRLAAAENDAQVERALNRARTELAQGYAQQKGGAEARAAAKRVLQDFEGRAAALKASRGDLDAAAKQIKDIPTLESYGAQVDLAFAQRGPTRANFRAAGERVAAGRDLARRDPTNAAAALDEAEKAQQAAIQQADAELQRALAVASSPQAVTKARTDYGARLKQVITGGVTRRIRGVNTDIRKTQTQIAAAEIALEQAKAAGGDIAGGASIAKRQADLKALRAKIAELRRRKGALRADLARQEAVLAALEAANEQQKVDDSNALFDARTAAKSSQITDPVAAARYQGDRAAQNLKRILKQNRGNKNSVAYQNALASVGNAQQAITAAEKAAAKEEVDKFGAQLEANRSAANIGASEEAKLQGAVSDAQALLGHLQGSGADRSEILGAMTSLNNARAALVDYMRQSAEDLAAARVEYQLSLTEDPVKRARIEYRGAQQAVKFARTPADRLRAEAAANNKRRELQTTVYGERISDIDLDLDLEKIDASQAIQRYEQLLKTIKGNKQLKNDLRRKIHQLKKDLEGDEGDLNLDNLKLPTTYEIRRAVAGGREGVSVTNQYRTEINVSDPQTALVVGDQMERYHEGSGKAIQRAVGMR